LISAGKALDALGRYEDAVAKYRAALDAAPDSVDALKNCGMVLQKLNRSEEAIESLERGLAVEPNDAQLHCFHGIALGASNRAEEALAAFGKAIALKADYAEAHYNAGVALAGRNRHEEALATYDRALVLIPAYAEALNNRGTVLENLDRHEEAIVSHRRALAVRPDHAGTLTNLANALGARKRYGEAIEVLERLRAVQPDHRYLVSQLARCELAVCNWGRTAELAPELDRLVLEGKSIIDPLTYVSYSDEPDKHLKCAVTLVHDRAPVGAPAIFSGPKYKHQKVRVAYLSGDFREHATAFLMAELFELHDRSRFEMVGISYSRDDGSSMRRRLVAAFDQFHDVRAKSDREAAELINKLEIDIAVDLKGYTGGARQAILAWRPAPIAASYLGYPGTTGADFVDYIIADRHVLPLDQQPFYTEKIVHLPDCYQPNDSKRKIADRTPTRLEASLPDEGFVLCCFNNNFKITKPVFETWCRILSAVPGSVLWLLRDNAGAESNLRRELEARGFDHRRMVFADRVRLDEHLARHRLADLFLDTLPYNAHTTASDALWAGLPVLTCTGRAFAGRVATSLLHAIGLPELVTSSLEEYEALAVKLARRPDLLRSIRARLERNRSGYPLFDTDRLRRHLESAYMRMWDLWQRGEPPASFSVDQV
jgi:predicted O-linked N-acetylglucosamine transferase (SPINDLY family)